MRSKTMPKIMLFLPSASAHYVTPPIGLGYLAAALKKAGFEEVAILDGQKENLSFSELEQRLINDKPDVIGVQIFSLGYSTARAAIGLVRRLLPETIIIVGGPHVTATADRVLADLTEADYGFIGEAEPGLPLLLQKLFRGREVPVKDIPGLIYRHEGKVVVNPRGLVLDLDSLGFPAWECMPPNTYPDAPQGAFYERFPIAPILTSRGCPFDCTFCGSPVNMTKRYRERSIPNVLAEIEMLQQKYGIREIHVIDDMFSLHKQRVLDFCGGLLARKIDISYTFPNGLRLDTLDKEILTLMKKTGAYAFTVGIESGSERILKLMKKKLTLELIREKVELIRDCNLEPSGFFIVGFQGETREDIEATIQFAKSLPLKRAHFSNYLPLPGTESTNELIRTGEIQAGNWDELAYYKVPYSPKGISKTELKSYQRKAFLGFYLRPHIILKMFSELRSFHHLRSIVFRAIDYLFGAKEKGRGLTGGTTK